MEILITTFFSIVGLWLWFIIIGMYDEDEIVASPVPEQKILEIK